MRNAMALIMVLLMAPVVVMADAADATAAVIREGGRAVFEEVERQVINKYYGRTDESRPEAGHKPGKPGKNKGLPPGIQQKLARGGSLPPGIAKRALPDGLRHQLPPVPRGYERTIVGTDVLLVEIATGVIADILVDVVTGD